MSSKIELTSKADTGAEIRRFLIIFSPLVALLSVVLAVFYYTEVRTERNVIKAKEVHNVNLGIEIIAGNLNSIVSDLMILSEQQELQEILEGNDGDYERNLRHLADNFLSFSNRIGIYDGHDLADGSTSFPSLTIQNGLCYQLIIKPRHNADLDLNQKIDYGDFALIRLYWLLSGAGPSNRWNNLADIDRDTITNLNDLFFIGYDWLWTQDPNLM